MFRPVIFFYIYQLENDSKKNEIIVVLTPE